MRTHPASGFSLTELLFALLVAGALIGAALPRLTAALDLIAVRGAADAFAAQAAQARALAIARGGARLVIDVDAQQSWLEDAHAARFPPHFEFAHTFGATIDVSGDADGRTELVFDALGLGRMANRTVRFQRGRAERRLTFSAYGRAREW